MEKEYSLFDVSKIDFEYVGDPVSKNETKNQIEITVSNLYVRTSPSVNSKIVGFINSGIYDYLEVQQSDGYSWYYIGIGWVAYSNEWARIYEIPKEENKDKNNKIEKSNFFVKIFIIIINFLKKIFKRN